MNPVHLANPTGSTELLFNNLKEPDLWLCVQLVKLVGPVQLGF